jgi:copper chaperone
MGRSRQGQEKFCTFLSRPLTPPSPLDPPIVGTTTFRALFYEENGMLRFKIAKMTCGHCAASVERAVRSVDPRAAVSIDLARQEVAIQTAAEERLVAGALRSAGYESQAIAA